MVAASQSWIIYKVADEFNVPLSDGTKASFGNLLIYDEEGCDVYVNHSINSKVKFYPSSLTKEFIDLNEQFFTKLGE